MTENVVITAIFERNLFFSELISLMKAEGQRIVRKKTLSNLNDVDLIKGLILIDIDSKKSLDKLSFFKERKNKSYQIICFLNKEIDVNENFENIRFIRKPIIFNEFLEIISNLKKNMHHMMKVIKIKNLVYYENESKFINQNNNETISLTDLENNLVSFIIKKDGATKSEILKNVWKHNVILETHSLESLIYRLRRKIEENPNQPQILIQLRKKYYLTL